MESSSGVLHRVSRLPLLQVHERVSRLLLQVRHSVRPLLLFQVRHRVRPHLLLQVRHSVRPLLLLQLSHVSRLRRLSNRRRDTPQLWCVAVRVEVVQEVQAEASDINMVQASSLFRRGLMTGPRRKSQPYRRPRWKPILHRNRHRRQGRKCLRKRLTTSFIWLNHQLPSLLTQTMSATSGS